MEQKLIFLDIDGTLTEPGCNTPPESALEAIRRARRAGNRVFLCSGRSYGMVKPLLQYGFDGAVCSAGGHIRCGGAVIYDCPMTPEQQEKAMAVFAENGVFRTVEGLETSYTDEAFKTFLRENARTGGNSELLRWREQVEKELNILPMAEYRGESIYKILFMSPDERRLEVPRRVLEAEFQFCIQENGRYGITNGELINRRFNKGSAVRRVSEHLGIPMANTVAFGDSMNDVEMLQTAALSLCMDNGAEALKKIAGAVCPGVSEDGLFRAFREYRLF